tara:strand:- start:6086 stop:7474 length:1389 start_codon:yes stop_codon:yes gene_type:complete
MPTYGQYYFDGLNFSTCVSVYTDSALTLIAPDGWYSQGSIVREMLNSILLAASPCPECIVPCSATPLTASGGEGVYKATFSFGTDTGAAIINFNVGNNQNPIPDKLTWTFDGTSASEYSSYLGGYLQGYLGAADQDTSGNDCTCCGDCYVAEYGANGITVANGSNGVARTGVSVFNYISGSFQASGSTQNVPAWGGNATGDQTLNECDPSSTTLANVPYASFNATMVVPVPVSAGSTTVEIEILAPCEYTFFEFTVNCPSLLTGFSSTTIQLTEGASCGIALPSTIYHAGVNTLGNSMREPAYGGAIPATPDTQMGIHDWVFEDAYGVTQLPAGWYGIQNLIAGVITAQVIEVSSDGIITTINNCPACSNTIYLSGMQALCETFCDGVNRVITTSAQTVNCHDYSSIAIGDVIVGTIIAVGWYAYAATSTDTATGPFQMIEITTNNVINDIKECSGVTCVTP